MSKQPLELVFEHYKLGLDNDKACCPFHNENTPSFVYYRETDTFHCFGCGVSGDVINFIAGSEGITSKGVDFVKCVEIYDSVVGDGAYDRDEDVDLSNDVEFTAEYFEAVKNNTSNDGKGYRGIDRTTNAKAGVRYEFSQETGEVIRTYYPATIGSFSDGLKGFAALSGLKIRTHPKKFSAVGKVGKGCEFFMQHMFTTHKGFLLIVEGEIDALSAYQMLVKDKRDSKFDEVAVVSPLTGANSLAQTIKDNYEWVSQFKRIIICMDNDAAGRKAAGEAMQAIPKGRGYVVNMRRKDVNEFLMAGDEKGFLNDFWNMQVYTPEGIYSSTQLYEEALVAAESSGISLPDWAKGITEFTYGFGIPENETCVLVAQSSGGKTLFINNLTIYWALNEPKHTIGVMSLEATAGRYARNLLSSYLGVPLNRMSADERVEFLSKPHIKEKSDKLFMREDGSPRFWILDDRGAEVDVIKEKVERMVKELGCTIIIADPWSDLLSNLSVAEQEDLSTWLKKLQKETGITPIIVSHIRKGGIDEHGAISEDSIMGSSFLAKAAGLTIALERDKQAEDEIVRNTTRVRILKNREHAETGVCGHIFFNKEDQKLYDFDEFFGEKSSTPDCKDSPPEPDF